jgi:endonuclease/exonuclease/phosphatase family metal-dependent hydrolase
MSKVKKILKNILTGLNLGAVLFLIIAYLSVYISPEKCWVPSFFGLAYPVILIINLFFVVMWLIINPGYLWISLIVILAGWGFLTRFVQVRGKNIDIGDINVLSYNVQYFAGNGKESQKKTAKNIKQFLKEQELDIICLQEVRLRKNNIFNLAQTAEELDNIKHYQYARSSTTYGSVTMTRYPIINMGEIRFENSRNITIYTDVMIGNDTVRIFNVHLQSYNMDPDRYSIIDSGIDEEEDLREVHEIFYRFKKGFHLRAQQVKVIRRYIEQSPYHIILCGDFNDTPASYSYSQLKKGLKDAFVCSGTGVGRTYIGRLPSFRIDYIFHSKGFYSYNFKTGNFRSSDHLPVTCSLVKR